MNNLVSTGKRVEMHAPARVTGFTLIELSIVLTIIGLVVGGVLVGQDLIRAAAVRAQISQIEKYQTAVNAFRSKFGALPGDLNQAVATQYGFASRGDYAGEGDGNGIIDGIGSHMPDSNRPYFQAAGETAMFWVDLSKAGLIDSSFNTAQSNNVVIAGNIQGTQIGLFCPEAKIGHNNYVYIWNGGVYWFGASLNNGINYFGIEVILDLHNTFGDTTGTTGFTVYEAYTMDKKIDDGLPLTGRLAQQRSDAGVNFVHGEASPGVPAVPAAGDATTCYDGSGGSVAQYSINKNNGAGLNCVMSIMVQ